MKLFTIFGPFTKILLKNERVKSGTAQSQPFVPRTFLPRFATGQSARSLRFPEWKWPTKAKGARRAKFTGGSVSI